MDLTTTNTWLALGAMSLLVIALSAITAVVVLIRTARSVSVSADRVSVAIEQVTQHVSPLAAQTSAFLNDVHDLVQQLRRTDTMTTAAVERIVDRWRRVSTLARSGLWPAITAARGAAALVQWIAGRLHARSDEIDRADEARFTYEGGARRS